MDFAELINRKDEIEYQILLLSQDAETAGDLVMELEEVLREIIALGG